MGLLALAQSLHRHALLRVVTVQVIVRAIMDIFLEPSICRHSQWRSLVMRIVHQAFCSAAQNAQSYLHGKAGEHFLELFMEEWELHKEPPVDVAAICGDARCLIPAPTNTSPGLAAEWTMPHSQAEAQNCAKAIRLFLILRRLRSDLAKFTTLQAAPVQAAPVPRWSWVCRSVEEFPLKVEEELRGGLCEGQAFELGRQDRIVCGVAGTAGKNTRYLVMHQYLLLLVQPDLTSPGWAVVRTLCPLRQVEAQVDRSDPRTLRLVLHVTKKGGPTPGEAVAFDPSQVEPGRRPPTEDNLRCSSYYMITLNFEDVKGCHCADMHIQKHGQKIRSMLLERLEAFIKEGVGSEVERRGEGL